MGGMGHALPVIHRGHKEILCESDTFLRFCHVLLCFGMDKTKTIGYISFSFNLSFNKPGLYYMTIYSGN